MKFNDPKFKNEIFVRIGMILPKLFVCNHFFLLLKHFVVCKKLIIYIKKFLSNKSNI